MRAKPSWMNDPSAFLINSLSLRFPPTAAQAHAMRFHRGLLATVFILVAATNALASKSTTEPDLGDNHKRLLRVSKTPDEEEREES
ncbi:uncharacterized protein KRP23_19 [Phytophthora ramorum]|uniref:uncharacterized protein n=1 Tax=Phytophthora ramorum TaxID=164328 RepID=UPI003096F20D|nr:hypothetical protein KRP23_19 [Phytophthora ramorum]